MSSSGRCSLFSRMNPRAHAKTRALAGARSSSRNLVVADGPRQSGRHVAAARLQLSRSARTRTAPRTRAVGEEKIDPTTGMPLSDSDVVKKDAVEINGTTWAYRYTEGDEDKPTVVLLHGALSSSYSYRRVIDLLGREGYNVIAPDWPGHGASSVPAQGKFAYTDADYVHGLAAFLKKVVSRDTFVLVTQGFVLGQYGLLYALNKGKDKIEKLVILNTPLTKKTALPPILSKLAGTDGGFLGSLFGGIKSAGPLEEVSAQNYMQGGSPYFLDKADADAYQEAFEAQANRDAAQAMMENLEYESLVRKIDEGFQTWKVDSLVAFGTSDYYVVSPFLSRAFVSAPLSVP